MTGTVHLSDASTLPKWQRPIALLFLMAFAMPIAFSVWLALLNNFVVEAANFDGVDIGLLHAIREIPGFLAVGVIAVIIFVREQGSSDIFFNFAWSNNFYHSSISRTTRHSRLNFSELCWISLL